jgi:integrase
MKQPKAYVHARDAEGNPTIWAVAVELGQVNGKRARKKVFGKTAEEATRAAAQLYADMRTGMDAAKDKTRLSEYLPRWLEHEKEQIAPRSWESYERITYAFLIPELGHIYLSRLDGEQVDRFIADMRQRTNPINGKPYAHSYINKIRGVLRAALNQAARWKYVAPGNNAAALSEPVRTRKKRFARLTPSQVRAILRQVEGHPYEVLYHALAKTGLRKGEVLAWRWADVDLDEGIVMISGSLQRENRMTDDDGPKSKLVRRDHTKTESGDDRPLALQVSLVPMLRRLKAEQALLREAAQLRGERWEDTDLVFTSRFGTAIEPRSLHRHFKDVLVKAGLPTTVRIHDLRHANVSAMIAAGVDPETARERAGHSDIKVTLGIYTHSDLELQRAAAAIIDALYHDEETSGATRTNQEGH